MGRFSKIAVVGGGNMGRAIARGVVKAGLADAGQIVVTRRGAEALRALAAEGFATTTDNAAAVEGADMVVFAVKPYQLEAVVVGVRGSLRPGVVAVSIATGVGVERFAEMLGEGVAAVRVMPNTAAEVGESLTAIVPAAGVPQERVADVVEVFSALGLALVVDEAMMPALTALASCGVAHALRYIRAAQESAIEMGVGASLAAQVVAQTVKGAAQLVLTNRSHPEAEIDKVCTPGGVTIAGVNAMERAGFSAAVMQGMMGSYAKIVK